MAPPLDLLTPWGIALGLNTLLLSGAWLSPKKLLTPAGYLHAWILGVIVWICLGWRGYGIVMVYFLTGSSVTRIGMAQKEAAGIAEKRSGARGPENVWGSALVGTLCAVGVGILAGREEMTAVVSLLTLAYVASFSTKLSDTTASEVGKVYGKRTFLITTLQPVPPGTEGAVSLEGTLAGIVGSAVIALAAWGLGLISPVGIALCLGAAFIATNLESVIGATLQTRWGWLTNELVNIANTAIGALSALLLGSLVD
ncbi:TIGR00297 family protein [Leptolyngbya sp. PCC 6406]|uniref:TIGR00297 family protein n=1 Tax=Leptolyngbya sp. PCC 6406 TaxID=1173264 RepID=UPI000489DF72|nr:TIGR00297 family protein [Leptolyngbya sp. PCC 6406]